MDTSANARLARVLEELETKHGFNVPEKHNAEIWHQLAGAYVTNGVRSAPPARAILHSGEVLDPVLILQPELIPPESPNRLIAAGEVRELHLTEYALPMPVIAAVQQGASALVAIRREAKYLVEPHSVLFECAPFKGVDVDPRLALVPDPEELQKGGYIKGSAMRDVPVVVMRVLL